MKQWSEDEIRRAVSWQAFREGKSLAGRGAAEGLRHGDGVATAVFRRGKRRLRTVVRTDPHLEAECQCAENRRTGEICAHAVAVLLGERGPDAPREETPAAEKPTPVPQVESRAHRVRLPPDFAGQLAKGALSCQIEATGPGESEADAGLSAWLAEHAPDTGSPAILSVRGTQLSGLLAALAGHERVFGDDGRVIRVAGDPMPPLPLRESERSGERVRFVLATEVTPVDLGGALGWIHDDVIGRAPVEAPPPAWIDEARELLEEGSLSIRLDDFLPALDHWLDLFQAPPPGWLGDLTFRKVRPRVEFALEGSLRALDGTLELRNPPDMDGDVALDAGGCVRSIDPDAGVEILRRLRAMGFEIDGSQCRLRDEDRILEFVADELPRLEREWQVRVGERLRHVLKSVHVVRPEIESGSGGSTILDLSFQTNAGKPVPYAKIREILRTGKRAATTRNGAKVVISRSISKELEPLLADLGIASAEGRLQLDRAASECLRMFRENSLNTVTSSYLQTDPSIDDATISGYPLRPYQAEGVAWLADRLETLGGALLADEMGLGKTIQTIAAIKRLKAGEVGAPALIVVPTSLLGNWREELERFAPEWSVVTLHGSGRDAKRGEAGAADIVLTSYGTLARDLAFHLRADYAVLAVDEASMLRNPDSDTSRAVAKLEIPKRVALTGTPVENRLGDLWAIFRVVAPGYLGAKDEFLERYADAEAARRLRWRIAPYVLRRTKTEVAPDLPDRIELDHWLELESSDRELYQAIAGAGLERWQDLNESGQAGAARMHLLTVILRLRQLCLDRRLVEPEHSEPGIGAKTLWLDELLSERSDENQKTLVFSQFREYLRIIENQSNDRWGRVFRLDGTTGNRSKLVREFQQEEGPAVFLISLKAGGYGLNLTAADAVVHLDPWWNPAVEAQASDRAHRIGQDRPVTIHRLLTRDTVEERVRRIQAAKQRLIEGVSATDPDSVPSDWGEAELRDLVT